MVKIASIKKMGDGRYYINKKVKSTYHTGCAPSWRNWFFIKQHLNKGVFDIGNEHIYTPKELIGKRVRLVVEIIKGKR